MSGRVTPTKVCLVGPPRPDTVARLRDAAVEAAGSNLDDARLADVALVASELVTNAIEYGPKGADVAMEITTDEREITVVVTNTADGAHPPPQSQWRIAAPDVPRGRGLGIVRRLAPRLALHQNGDQISISACWPVGPR